MHCCIADQHDPKCCCDADNDHAAQVRPPSYPSYEPGDAERQQHTEAHITERPGAARAFVTALREHEGHRWEVEQPKEYQGYCCRTAGLVTARQPDRPRPGNPP